MLHYPTSRAHRFARFSGRPAGGELALSRDFTLVVNIHRNKQFIAEPVKLDYRIYAWKGAGLPLQNHVEFLVKTDQLKKEIISIEKA